MGEAHRPLPWSLRNYRGCGGPGSRPLGSLRVLLSVGAILVSHTFESEEDERPFRQERERDATSSRRARPTGTSLVRVEQIDVDRVFGSPPRVRRQDFRGVVRTVRSYSVVLILQTDGTVLVSVGVKSSSLRIRFCPFDLPRVIQSSIRSTFVGSVFPRSDHTPRVPSNLCHLCRIPSIYLFLRRRLCSCSVCVSSVSLLVPYVVDPWSVTGSRPFPRVFSSTAET